MSISDIIKRSDAEDVERDPSRTARGIDPTILLERSFLQWNIIDSIANAVLGWIVICTYLFWADPEAKAFSVSGIVFILIGLVCFADIFGVLIYKTNQLVMIWQKHRHPPFPDIRKLKRLSKVSSLVWFIIMFAASKYSFDLVYELLKSFTQF